MTTTGLGPQTPMPLMGPTAARRAARLFPPMETESWVLTATRTPTETPRAPVGATQLRSAAVRAMVAPGPNPRGNALVLTPSRGSPAELGLPSPTNSWWRWRTSSSPHGTYPCVSASTWPCPYPLLRPRSRSGSRIAGPSGRSRTPGQTPQPPPEQEEEEAAGQGEDQEGAWGASARSAHPPRSLGTWPCTLVTRATITPQRGAWSSCRSWRPATSSLHSCWGHRAMLPLPSTAHICRPAPSEPEGLGFFTDWQTVLSPQPPPVWSQVFCGGSCLVQVCSNTECFFLMIRCCCIRQLWSVLLVLLLSSR